MIGFVTTKEQADAVNAAIAEAQTSRGMPVFWLAGSTPIHSGTHAGMHFIPCDEDTLSTPLVGNPPKTPVDFPEFQIIVETLGGLEARIDLDSQYIVEPKVSPL
jgi:hypothetical protein